MWKKKAEQKFPGAYKAEKEQQARLAEARRKQEEERIYRSSSSSSSDSEVDWYTVESWIEGKYSGTLYFGYPNKGYLSLYSCYVNGNESYGFDISVEFNAHLYKECTQRDLDDGLEYIMNSIYDFLNNKSRNTSGFGFNLNVRANDIEQDRY